MLAPYTFKYIQHSVEQAGDPVPRHVYHVYNAMPLAVLFMDGHYAGKTRAAEAIIKPDLKRLSGDAIYYRIFEKTLQAPPELAALVQPVPGTDHIDSAVVVEAICKTGLLPQLIGIYVQLAAGTDFVLDAYIPESYQEALAVALSEAGFFLVNVHIAGSIAQAWTRRRPPVAVYKDYMENLIARSSIDEAAYLAANPDVAKAVAEGKLPSAQIHYCFFGRREKRKLRP